MARNFDGVFISPILMGQNFDAVFIFPILPGAMGEYQCETAYELVATARTI